MNKTKAFNLRNPHIIDEKEIDVFRITSLLLNLTALLTSCHVLSVPRCCFLSVTKCMTSFNPHSNSRGGGCHNHSTEEGTEAQSG